MSTALKPADDSMLSVHHAQWAPMQADALQSVMQAERDCYEFPWSEGNFQDSIRSGYRCMTLRTDLGELIGYSVTMRGVDEAHLLNIAVAPAHQRCGWARVLLDDLVIASREHAQWVWLEVRQSNAHALRLYEQYGLRVVGHRKDYYPATHNRREDAVIMSLKL